MGEVSLWLTQKLNASMEEHEETSELRDSEDDHDIKNDDKLEGNSSSNCDFSYFGVTAEYPSIGSYNPEKAGYMDTQLSPANALRTRNTCMSYLPCVC